MSGVLHLAPWRTQPQGAVDLRPPRGTNEVWGGQNIARTLIRAQPTVLSSASQVATDRGFALRLTSTVDSSLQISDSANLIATSTSSITIAMLRRCRDTTLRENVMFGYSIDASSRILAPAPWVDGNVYWDFGNISSGRLISSGFVKSTQWETLVFLAGPTKGHEIWRNGVRIAHKAYGGAYPGADVPFVIGGITGLGGDEQDVALFLTAAGVEWTDDEIRAWSADVLNQTYAPRQIYVPSAAGIALPTLSLSTFVPGSMTSTGWRPQVTAS